MRRAQPRAHLEHVVAAHRRGRRARGWLRAPAPPRRRATAAGRWRWRSRRGRCSCPAAPTPRRCRACARWTRSASRPRRPAAAPARARARCRPRPARAASPRNSSSTLPRVRPSARSVPISCAPRHHRDGHGVVDQEQPDDQRDPRQRGEVGVKRREHGLDLLAAAGRPLRREARRHARGDGLERSLAGPRLPAAARRRDRRGRGDRRPAAPRQCPSG